jgi:putative addiction module killer protein
MFVVEKTDKYSKWIETLKDKSAKVRILARIDKLELGHFGDVKPVGEGVSELRVNCGAGYRIYFKQTGKTIVFLLCGGDKSTQFKDIQAAKNLAREIENAS